MKHISSKVFIIILACSVVSLFILGAISIYESATHAKEDAEKALLWMARDYADKFSSELMVIEDKVSELELFIQNSIDFNKLKSDKNYLATYEPILAKFAEDFANKRTKSIAAWIYFDPKWSDTPHDVYFVDGDGDGKADRQNYIPFSYYDNTPLPDDDKQWWYGPIAAGKTFWTNPYEWTLKNGEVIKVVSCARPIYINGELVGVVGTYYRFNTIYNEIKSIKVYNHDYTMLLNEKLDIIIHPDFTSGTRFTSDNLQTVAGGKYKKLSEALLSKHHGIVTYERRGVEKIIAFATLSNGWIMGITSPISEVYENVYNIIYTLLAAMLVCFIIALFAAYYMGKYISNPILKVAKSARIIGSGDLSVHVDVDTKDEVRELAESLNSMTANIKSLQSDIIRQAHFDELTGAKNLRKFKIDVAKLLEQYPDKKYALVKLDISKFKMFNELYGFDEGDKIIKNIVGALGKAANNEVDAFARINSDEFIALFSYEDLNDVDKKRKLFEENFHNLNENSLSYSVIFKEGLYLLNDGEKDIAKMIENVNIAHRLAKLNDSKNICVYDEKVKQIAIKEKEIENKMEAALFANEFKLYLQPKYGLKKGNIVGAEALVRWQAGSSSISYPNEFIPIFERNGFIVRLDFYMLEESCKVLRKMIDDGYEPVKISVNFSRLHFANPEFLERLCATIDKYNVPRKFIEVELTETAMLYNVDSLIEFLSRLHGAGVKLSMDDFGTGYSSLGLLKNLPVDVVKLDRSFFLDATDERRTMVVIESIIAMTKKLGIETVAEGVEEKAQVDLLREMGCDTVQGYYFAKPMPKDDFLKLVEK